MATGFPQLDQAEGTVASYYGTALMAIEKDGNGSWWTRDAAVSEMR